MGNRMTPTIAVRHFDRDAQTADPGQLDLGISADPTRGSTTRTADPRMQDETSRADVRRERLAMFAFMLLGALAGTASPVWAAGAGSTMPWDGPLQALVNNLTGTTARALVLLAVVGAGLLWAFTRNEEGLKKLGQITFGGAIALGAATLMASLGFAGATF